MKLQKEPIACLVHDVNGNLIATLFSERDKVQWKNNLGSDTDTFTDLYEKEPTHFNLIGKSPDPIYRDFRPEIIIEIQRLLEMPLTPEIFARLVAVFAVEELRKVEGANYDSVAERFTHSPPFTLAIPSNTLSISVQLALREECNCRGISLIVW